MKYVYLVQERNFREGNKGEFCGVAYYTSYKKALSDFDNRVERYKSCELIDSVDEKGNFLVTHIREFKWDEVFKTEIQLLKYEVY